MKTFNSQLSLPRAAKQPGTFSLYYRLTKPGIIRGNAITALAGAIVAFGQIHGSGWAAGLGLSLAMLAGLSLIIASACVCNNYMDRELDKKMVRTCDRPLATGRISGRSALTFAAVLGGCGTIVLLAFTNPITAAAAVFGFVAYVVLYGAAKRTTVHGTVIGSISGAVPPVVGYTAVTGRIDLAAVLLFATLVCWQMPHFYAIATYRAADYAAAKLPVLPVVAGLNKTKLQMIIYTLLFVAASLSLYIAGYTGLIYALGVGLAGLAWTVGALRGLRIHDKEKSIVWAKQMFGLSLLVITVWSVTLGIDRLFA